MQPDQDSEYDDCRAIEEVGFMAPTLRRASANVVAARIHQGQSDFHLERDGRRIPLQGVKDPDVHYYVRTLDEDGPDDPLLQLPACTTYEREQELSKL